MSYPFFAKSTTFASLIVWKAEEAFEKEILDLTFPNKVSAVSLGPDSLFVCSPSETFSPFFTPAPALAEVSADSCLPILADLSEDSCFPIPKVSLT